MEEAKTEQNHQMKLIIHSDVKHQYTLTTHQGKEQTYKSMWFPYDICTSMYYNQTEQSDKSMLSTSDVTTSVIALQQ